MRFAKIISFVFHPLFMPILGLFIVLDSSVYVSSSIGSYATKITFITVFVFTCLLPLISVIFMLKKGMVNSIYLTTRQERKYPYLMTVLYYTLLYYILRPVQLPPVIYQMILGSIVATIMAMAINLKWKISAHMIGIGGVIGTVIGIAERFTQNLNSLLVVLFICAGLVGFARLKLNAHDSAQVYLGFIVGVFTLLLMIILP